MELNKSIFRKNDIRGRVDNGELSEELYELLGKAYGTFLLENKVATKAVVGRDNRETSEKFAQAFIEGVLSTGVDVIDLGIALSPMVYWSQFSFDTGGSAMVTASHNSKEWNGLKISSGVGGVLSGEDLYKVVERSSFKQGIGQLTHNSVKEEYIKDLVSRINIEKELKVVVNTGNGTAGFIVPDLMRAAGVEVVEHNTKSDPSFPNYTPNPKDPQMVEDTGKMVLKNKANFGLAFDADGDRLGLTDENGEFVPPDLCLIFLARDILKNKPASSIVCDVLCSQAVKDEVEALGGVLYTSPIGYFPIKQKMLESDAELAGEISGHIYYKYNYYGFDDACFAALNLIQYFSNQEKSVSQLVAELPKYESSPAYYINVGDSNKEQIVKSIIEEFKKQGLEILDIDGGKIIFPKYKGWGLIRQSNTSPSIVLRFESKTKEGLGKIEGFFREKLERREVMGEWRAG